jgi:coatomer subunit epsilon
LGLGWYVSFHAAPVVYGFCSADNVIQGGERYQQAFYVFEELAQAPSTSSTRSLVSQAVAELHLGRTEEAQAALEQAMQKEPQYAEAIANLLVLTVITGKDPAELTA